MYSDTEIDINNIVTGGNSMKLKISDYVSKLDEMKDINLDDCKTKNKLLNNVKNTVKVFSELGLSNNNEEIDYEELMGNFGILNHILNDVILYLADGRNDLGVLLCKYKKDNKRLFTNCEAFNLDDNSETYDNVRDFFGGILDVHNRINKQVQRVKNNHKDRSIMNGGVILNRKSHQFIIDYSSLTGGNNEECCRCPKPINVDPPTTGDLHGVERYEATDDEIPMLIKLISKIPGRMQIAGSNNEVGEEEDKNEEGENEEGEDEEGEGKKSKSLEDFFSEGDRKMKDLVYSERNLTDNDKSQFDWIYWKFYRLWTMEKLHPVLTLPFDMVDPILQTIGVLVKKIVSPIIGKTIPPILTTVWQGIGALISASAMIPFVGSVTGAFAAAHNVASVPVSIMIREASAVVQFIIDGSMEFMSMIYNLQRKNWGLVVDAFLRAFQLNGLYATFLGHVRTLTKLLKRINNIVDELKQYPDFADQVLKKMDEYPEILEWLKRMDVEKLQKNMVRILKIGTGLTKNLSELTDGLAFTMMLPDSLIDDDDDRQFGGADREKLVKQYLKIAFTPINTNDKELIREKMRLLYQLDNILH